MRLRNIGILVAALIGITAIYIFSARRSVEPSQDETLQLPTEREQDGGAGLGLRFALALAKGTEEEPATEVAPPTNRLAAIGEDTDTVWADRETIERWLALNKTNAGSLLAAAQVGKDRSLYLTALTNFPNDPRVLFAVAAPDRLPEIRRDLLDRLKAAAPDNALADYLSARDHMKNGRTEEAIADLVGASGKGRFSDYTLEDLQNREDLLLDAGKSPAEAKVLAGSHTLLPHLSQMKGLAQDMATLQKQYIANGDVASAERLAQMGLQLSQRLTSGEGAGNLINNLVGYAVERIVISPLDQQTPYDFMGGTPSQRIDWLQSQRAESRTLTKVFNHWWPTASESEVISFFDRQKIYGETATLRWLQSRHGP